mmetsp:Transcript_18167/g.27267  ORF Transcript_18167/g.27267 Transcript_18167/m.27267 type:complete len:775 (-) Transcript_18167:194-2518(-)
MAGVRHSSEILMELEDGTQDLIALCKPVLPGLRIKDRESYGVLYLQCFIANEIVSYLILNRIADDENEAVEMLQKLHESGIFLQMVPGQHFQNKYLLFQLNMGHEIVRSLGRLEMCSGNEKEQTFKYVLLNTHDTCVGMSDWLEKKGGFIGGYDFQYFRVMATERKVGFRVGWFEDEVSLKAKGYFDSDEILMVDYMKSKCTIVVSLTTSKRKLYFRVQDDTRKFVLWHRILQKFARIPCAKYVLEKSGVGHVLSDKEFTLLLTHCEIVKVKMGTVISGKGLNIIGKGMIGVFATGENKTMKFFCHRPENSIIGCSVDLNKGFAWKALEDCLLLSVHPKKFKQLTSKQPRIMQKIEQLYNEAILTCLKSNPIFRELSESNRARLKLILKLRKYEKNEMIYRQGVKGASIYILLKGAVVESHYYMNTQKESLIREFSPGETFGEICILHPGSTRECSALSTADSLVLELEAEDLRAFFQYSGLNMAQLISPYLIQVVQRSNIPFLSHFTFKKLRELIKRSQLEYYDEKEVVYSKGDKADRFYLALSGSLAVEDGKNVWPSIYFGEKALALHNYRRQETVICQVSTCLLTIDRDTFKHLYGIGTAELATAEIQISERNCEIRSILYHPKGIQIFETYLDGEGGKYFITAWKEMKAFRMFATPIDLNVKRRNEIQQKAEDLLKRCFSEDRKECTIKKSLLTEIQKEVELKEAHAATFVRAELHLMDIMSRTYLEGFKRSMPFFNFLKMIKSSLLMDVREIQLKMLVCGSRSKVFSRS